MSESSGFRTLPMLVQGDSRVNPGARFPGSDTFHDECVLEPVGSYGIRRPMSDPSTGLLPVCAVLPG